MKIRIPPAGWTPDFNQLKKVLEKKAPDRPVLFEFYMNDVIHGEVDFEPFAHPDPRVESLVNYARRFEALGYDYCCTSASPFGFLRGEIKAARTFSINDGVVITDDASFDAYPWDDPDHYDMDYLNEVEKYLPKGMKLVISGNDGVLENVIKLVGYQNLCMALYDNPRFVQKMFDKVGGDMVRYYEKCAGYNVVGALLSNDDWGFNTQTLLPPDAMREYVFPWHRRICQIAHDNGKFALLHSCGCYDAIIDDVINDMKFDGRHSYEDKIRPVEEAYEELYPRIAVLGGMDIGFMSTATPQQVFDRAKAMLERTRTRGGYALGTGNSVPDYIPKENYYAMLKAAFYETLV